MKEFAAAENTLPILVSEQPKKLDLVNVPARQFTTRQYESAVISLLTSKPFFAKLIMSMKKDFTFPIPTAGVSVSSTGITLHLNPLFFDSLAPLERVAILEHEVLHVLHSHAVRFKNFQAGDKGLANIACDVAINQYINNLPKEINLKLPDGTEASGRPCFYEDIVKEIKNLKPKMNSEYYFDKFKQEQEKMQGKEGTDDHSKWEETDLTEEQAERLVKGHVKAVLDSCSDQEKACVDKELIETFYKSDINWKSQLRQFFANAEETYTETTRKKRNRRYGIIQPGNKNEPKLKLGIAVDTSGSISNEELQLFFGEIDRIWNEHMVLYVLEADNKVQNCYEYKKGMKIEAKGRGGTAYNPALEKMKELKVDAGIYFGDMDMADKPNKPQYPVLWAIVRDSPPPASWGRKMYIK